MNQFKKARQRALETGHQVENIADLKTAGIKQETSAENKEIEKKATDEVLNPKPVKKINTETQNPDNTTVTVNSIDKTSMQNTVITEPKKQEEKPIVESNISSPAITDSSHIVEPEIDNSSNSVSEETVTIQGIQHNDVIETPTASPINITPEETIISEMNQPQSPTVQVQPSVQEYNTVDVPHSSMESPNISVDSEPETSITELEPTKNISATNAIPIPQKVPQTVIMTQASQVPQDNIYQTEQYKAAPQPARNTSSKKNIPNIFAPKGEAKSMRKSLVLKPTSVKIAENYCAKNGGSFNELVQTLLDNFIDEYGL